MSSFARQLIRPFVVIFIFLLALSAIAWSMRPEAAVAGRTPLIWTSDDNPARRGHIALFNQLNPDLELRLDPDNVDNEKVIVQSLGGVGPDLFDCWGPESLSTYVQAGIAWDVTDELAKHGVNPAKECWPCLVPFVQMNGRIYGCPANEAVDVLFFDRTVFDKAEEPYPTGPMTWDQALPMLQRMTQRDANGRAIRFGLAVDDDRFWQTLLMQWGAHVYSPDGTRCVLDSPQAIAAIQFLHDLIYRYKVTPTPGDIEAMPAAGGWGSTGMQLLSSHRAATAVGGRWWLCSLRTMKGQNLDACEAPHGPAGRVSLGYGKSTLINRASPRREQALRFLLYMASQQYTDLINQQDDSLGPIEKYCTLDSLKNPQFPQEWSFQHVFRDVAPLGRTTELVSPFVNSQVVLRLLNNQLDLVRRDAKPVDDAMRTAAAQVNEAIADQLVHDLDLAAQYRRLTGRDRP